MLDRTNAKSLAEAGADFNAAEREIFATARAAGDGLRRTFDTWLDLHAAIALAQRHAAVGGGSAKAIGTRRKAILVENGLEWLTTKGMRTTVKLLGRIAARLPAVQAWRATLSDYERTRWSSPQSVFNRCPALHPNGRTKGRPIRARPMSVSELLRMPADEIALLLHRRDRPKCMAIMRAMEELADTGSAVKPKSGWTAGREHAAGESVAAA